MMLLTAIEHEVRRTWGAFWGHVREMATGFSDVERGDWFDVEDRNEPFPTPSRYAGWQCTAPGPFSCIGCPGVCQYAEHQKSTQPPGVGTAAGATSPLSAPAASSVPGAVSAPQSAPAPRHGLPEGWAQWIEPAIWDALAGHVPWVTLKPDGRVAAIECTEHGIDHATLSDWAAYREHISPDVATHIEKATAAFVSKQQRN